MAAPWLYFSGKARKRAEQFENSILDLSLGLTSGLRAGQALPQALEVFSRRCEEPLKEELMIVIREYRLGLELSEALQRMYNRIPCENHLDDPRTDGISSEAPGSDCARTL